MRVFIAGHRGFFGSVLHQAAREAGHDVDGVDAGYFDPTTSAPRRDIRDLTPEDLAGFDAVVNLAAVCNDACGELSVSATTAVNEVAAVRVARIARAAGARWYVLASSCSVYGGCGDSEVDESSPVSPMTAYAASKIAAERSIAAMAGDSFAPVFLRLATLFGTSPSFRSDLLPNRIAGTAMRLGRIQVNGAGKLWRPLLHVRDAAQAVLRVLGADPAVVAGQVYNVGATAQNYRVIDVVDMAHELFPSAVVTHVPDLDRRSYAVRFEKFAATFEGWRPRESVWDGLVEVATFFDSWSEAAGGSSWGASDRRDRLLELLSTGAIDEGFRWKADTLSP
ncbi:SDR family oxidoreductase [Micromonospora sp. NPDC005652]|uniref:NAD-dependent epimerase/dehydratase family protein n=1 Tax=Micromonospora sp. NPDC005652 TaxID=3157046 RepID=UPI0033CE66FD